MVRRVFDIIYSQKGYALSARRECKADDGVMVELMELQRLMPREWNCTKLQRRFENAAKKKIFKMRNFGFK